MGKRENAGDQHFLLFPICWGPPLKILQCPVKGHRLKKCLRPHALTNLIQIIHVVIYRKC